jgi:glycosyltransferase involved in cell wall biosynthesis
MRVIFVPFIDAFGGVERLAMALSRFLFERRVEHEVVCFRDTIGMDSFADWPVAIRALGGRRHALAEVMSLRRFIARDLESGNAPLFFDLKGAFYAAHAAPNYWLHLTDPPSLLPADVSKHALSFPHRAAFDHAPLLRRLRGEIVHRINTSGVRRAKRVFCMTERIAAEITEVYSVHPLVVRPGVEATATKAGRRSCEGAIRILSVSRLEPNKRIEWILQAAASVAGRVAFHLDIVGSGSLERQLRDLAGERGIAQAVTFHGAIPDAALHQLYSRADVFAMPAAQGYGLPALEALARGVPAAIHRESGVAEILAGSPWVEIAGGGPDEFAAALHALIRRVAASESLGPQPVVNSADDWARTISTACGWI